MAAAVAKATGQARPGNNLLRILRESDYALLEPSLHSWEGPARGLLYDAGDNVDTVYFPCGPSLVSLLVAHEEGRDVETLLIGREGAVGGIVSHGNLPAFSRMVVQVGGNFVKLRASDLEAAKTRSVSLRYLFARYADCLVAQMIQSTACNAVHSIEQRAAKWIIAAMERTGDDLVPLTHEQLAAMLGVGRSYASRVIKSFKSEGILQTRRGALQVQRRDALQARSCPCNDAVRAHFDVVLRGVYPGNAD
jgi:hypothetical protein